MDDVRQAVSDFRQTLDGALDDGAARVTSLAKATLSEARALGEQQAAKAKEAVEVGQAHLQSADELVFAKLHEGVDIVLAHPNEAALIGAGAALLLLPASRGVLYRSTLGRFRSEEAVYLAGKRQTEVLKATLESASKQAVALAEAKTSGIREVQNGTAKLKTASRELYRLSSEVASAEADAKALMLQLRKLRSQEALKLRMEIAEHKARLGKMQKAAKQDFNQLLSKGYA